MNRTELIAAVREHALANYEDGWDVVVETFEDDEIAEVIGKARTLGGAVKRMAAHIEPYNERRREIEATADHDVEVPETFLSLEEALEVVEAEDEAHRIAEVLVGGTRAAEHHADRFPSWEMITTESGAFFSLDNDVVRFYIGHQRRLLGQYLSGEHHLGTDLSLLRGMCRDQAFVIRLMELELVRREREDEKATANEAAQQAEASYSPYPPATPTGVVCGNCTHRDGVGDRVIIRHATSGDVRDCYAARYEEEQQALAEIEADRRIERFYEEGF